MFLKGNTVNGAFYACIQKLHQQNKDKAAAEQKALNSSISEIKTKGNKKKREYQFLFKGFFGTIAGFKSVHGIKKCVPDTFEAFMFFIRYGHF